MQPPEHRGLAKQLSQQSAVLTSICAPDLSEMMERVQQLGKDLKALSCQLASLRNNGEDGDGTTSL